MTESLVLFSLQFIQLRMEQFLRPEWFSTDPESDSADKCWKDWRETFTNFIEVLHLERPGRPIIKRSLLTNYLSRTVNEIISDYVTYEEAIDVLNATYIEPKNEIFSWHLFATCRQESGETFDHFLKSLTVRVLHPRIMDCRDGHCELVENLNI